MKLARRLRSWRDAQKKTQVEAAAALGVPIKTYLNYEQGRRTPRGLALSVIQKKIGAKSK